MIFIPAHVAAVVMHLFAPEYRMQRNLACIFFFIVFHQVVRYVLCIFKVDKYVAVENKFTAMIGKTRIADHKAGRLRFFLVLFEQLVYFIKYWLNLSRILRHRLTSYPLSKGLRKGQIKR